MRCSLPVPVSLKQANLQAEIQRGRNAVGFYLAPGSTSVVRVATTEQTPDQITDNVVSALAGIMKRLPGSWSNVQALSLRTTTSVALPLYNSLPEGRAQDAPVLDAGGRGKGVRLDDLDLGDEYNELEALAAARRQARSLANKRHGDKPATADAPVAPAGLKAAASPAGKKAGKKANKAVV